MSLAARLGSVAGVKSVSVAGPGFLNIVLDAAAAGELARSIVTEGAAYGRSELLAGERLNLEFVSANPTGPLHLGGTRWAAVGDSLARILAAQGASVGKEYYFNDHGAQIDRYARSLLAAAKGEPTPEDGYGGAYIGDIAQRVLADHPDTMSLPDDEAQEVFRSAGVQLMFDEIKADLHDFGVDFDVYFHENELHETGAVEHAVDRLRELGHMYESDGALWLRTTEFGDDKDRVIVKSDGEASYFSGDLAYYLNKRERGFDRVVIMLGADHHGYIGRLMAMCAAFGDTPGVNLEILIGQMVNLLKDGEPVRMSKRAGNTVTMQDLVEAVGCRRGALLAGPLLGRLADGHRPRPADQAQQRQPGLLRAVRACPRGRRRPATPRPTGCATADGFDPSLLTHDTESLLLAALGEFPRVVAQAAHLREPHRVARYLEELAGTYHRWYDACRVRPDNADDPVTDLHRTRLWLNQATGQVIANGLGLLGVSAPDRM